MLSKRKPQELPLSLHPQKSANHSHGFTEYLPLALALIAVLIGNETTVHADRPNVIVIMSDDQGGGDYGFMGNDVIKTPNLDAMADKSAVLTNFYVSPVCAPTRASLMTGRYNYRTRCIDTYVGRAMMDTTEVTIAEFLRDAGYSTGIYGKWHLGDNYPLRPQDQGFQDSLIHRGGGIGQPSDPFGAEGKYTDPTLFKNGVETPKKGYCTDLYFDEAVQFIEQETKAGKNFFTYIATNAPHGPFNDVPESLYQDYLKVDFNPILVNKINPARKPAEFDKLARIAAMITNIDDNVGKLLVALNELGISENTIVIYLNDNGPNSMRYVGDMRGMKSHVDDGGIRSPLVFHWPSVIKKKMRLNHLCAHIDLLPTLLDVCDVPRRPSVHLDGRSFLPILKNPMTAMPIRQIVLQAHRGNSPQKFHHFALHEGPWKLVHPTGFGNEQFDGEPALELYHLTDDPKQQHDLSSEKPEIFNRLKQGYEDWFSDVSSTRPNNYAPPRIVIGTDHEPVSTLTRQDWRHASGQPWGRDSNGFWLLEAPEPAAYEVELIFKGDHPTGEARITAGKARLGMAVSTTQRRGHSTLMHFPSGKFKLQVDVEFDGKTQGPHQVILTRQD